jgi:hypothetical protein
MYFKALLKGIQFYIVFQFVSLYAQQDSIPKCSGCPCDKDLSPVGISMSNVHPKNEWMIAYKPMYMQGNGMRFENSTVSNSQVLEKYLMTSDKMRMQMHMLMVMYGLTDRLTLMGMMDYRVNSMQMIMLPGHVHGGATLADTISTETTNGFGDINLSVLYSFINQSNNVLMGTLGLSIPTGSVNQQGNHSSMYHNQRYPYMMQNGTGTFDANLKLTYTRNYTKTQIGIQASSIIRLGKTKYDYKWGNEYNATSWFSYRWLPILSTSVRMEYVYNSPMKGSDASLYSYLEPAANAQNYGGHRLLAHIGSYVYLFQTQKLGLEFGMPIFQSLNGYQTPLTYQIQAMYSLSF